MGARIHIHEWGKSTDPALVLLHGCPMNAEALAPLARQLADEFRVLVPDLPGNGDSPPLEGSYSLDRVRQCIEDELRKRQVERPILAGTSLGAYHALAIAIADRYPIAHVVSIAGFADLDQERRDMRAALITPILEEDLSAARWRELMVTLMLSPRHAEAHPEDADQVARWVRDANRENVARELQGIVDMRDLRPHLGSVGVPITLIVGELDAATPRQDSEEIHQRAPTSTLHVIAGAGHAVWIEAPEQLVSLIRRAPAT